MTHTNDTQTLAQLRVFACAELTESHIYRRLAARETNPANRQVLQQIASEEEKHYALIHKESGVTAEPDKLKIAVYSFLARILGLTFAIKLMENGEHGAVKIIPSLRNTPPSASWPKTKTPTNKNS